MTRKQEREQTFCLIFEKCFREETCEEILELAEDVRDFELSEYIKNVFIGIFQNLETIDDIISKYLQNWTIDRISKTDLSLLRLAVYEMKFCDDIPESVTVNEIVELAKAYSGDKGPAYINGVLGNISRSGELA